MPKLKAKSAAKKRFKVTATGKVLAGQAGKKHLLRNSSKSQLRNLRGTTTLCSQDAKNIKKYFLPNNY